MLGCKCARKVTSSAMPYLCHWVLLGTAWPLTCEMCMSHSCTLSHASGITALADGLLTGCCMCCIVAVLNSACYIITSALASWCGHLVMVFGLATTTQICLHSITGILKGNLCSCFFWKLLGFHFLRKGCMYMSSLLTWSVSVTYICCDVLKWNLVVCILLVC